VLRASVLSSIHRVIEGSVHSLEAPPVRPGREPPGPPSDWTRCRRVH